MERKQIAVRIPATIHEQAERVANERGLTLADTVRMFVYEMARTNAIPLPVQTPVVATDRVTYPTKSE